IRRFHIRMEGEMKRSSLTIATTCIAAALLAFAVIGATQGAAQDGTTAAEKFVPSPIFSPPYPTLPHTFRDLHTIQILCEAPKGAIKRALVPPLEPAGDGDKFVLLLGWAPDVKEMGFNVHEVAINVPVMYEGKLGTTTLIEYIDSDMGLIAGREIYGWPKKMAEITWMQHGKTGWSVAANKMKDQGNIPLVKVDYKITDKPSNVKWPEMGPTYLVRRIPPAAKTMKTLNQMICVGCSRPEDSGIPLAAPGGSAGAGNVKNTNGIATVQFFDGPNDPLTFLGPIKVLDAKMTVMEGSMPGGLGLGEFIKQWEE
ncbi:MAG: acetoacetate decarboxylase family protein, partial [Acidobacteriota bacterium]|nr:acetoacetate decarboxylase family protein [Acidobacteriota bacterium]